MMRGEWIYISQYLVFLVRLHENIQRAYELLSTGNTHGPYMDTPFTVNNLIYHAIVQVERIDKIRTIS